MKKIAYLLAIILSLTSCEKFLEEKPTDRQTVADSYDNLTDLYLNAVAARYHDVGGKTNSCGLQGTGRGVYDLNTFTTDEAIMPTRGADWYDGGLWQHLFLHDWNGLDPIGDTWNYLFKAIIGCNDGLEHIRLYASLHPDEDVSALDSEVRALRAMFYFYAMDLYGRTPIFSSSEPKTEELGLCSRSEVTKFIVSELQDAVPLLATDKSNQPGQYYGRMTQSVANFLLAKIALNSEIYFDDDWTDDIHPSGKDIRWTVDGVSMNAWEATIAFCHRIADNGYTLEEDFLSNFYIHNEYSKENIFTIPMDKNLYDNQFIYLFRSRHYNHASALGLNGENGASATVEALRTFGLKEDMNDFSDTDPRFFASYYFGAVYDLSGNPIRLDDGTELRYEPWAVALDVSNTKYEKTAGARMRKYEVDPNGTKDGCQSDNDIVLFRFADVLLMECEATVRNGGNGDDLLTLVRDRAGAPSIPATLQNILDERQRELAWEGWRRNDLIRFGKFTAPYTERPALPDEQETHYTIVFPIPGEVIWLKEGQKQNPGY